MEKRVLKFEDILKISAILEENGFSDANMTVVLGVASQALLNKINEDLFIRNKGENDGEIKSNVSEIDVNVNNINFKYILIDDTRGV